MNVGRFSVSINVGTATATPFSITSVSYPSTGASGNVGSDAIVKITIVADGPGTATYSITKSGAPTKNGDVTFTAAGSKVIDYPVPCTVSGTSDLDVSVYIDYPNHQTFSLTYSDLVCN